MARMIDEDVPATMKIDAAVSRTIHIFTQSLSCPAFEDTPGKDSNEGVLNAAAQDQCDQTAGF